MAQGKNWCFTLNNYVEADLEKFKAQDCRYLVVGKEKGENGTPHLQGFIIFNKNMRLTAVKAVDSRAHWELAKGSCKQASDYCKKDGDFYEQGDHPVSKGDANKKRWTETLALAKAGNIDEIDDDLVIRYYSTLKRIKSDYMQKPDDLPDVCGLWYYGEAGTGKTTKARTENPGAFIKSRDKWWDGYQGQEVVICDDLDKYHVALAGYLKDWADKWTFKAEFKGSVTWIRPKKFIITSQYHFDDIWTDKETREALARRYKVEFFHN